MHKYDNQRLFLLNFEDKFITVIFKYKICYFWEQIAVKNLASEIVTKVVYEYLIIH